MRRLLHGAKIFELLTLVNTAIAVLVPRVAPAISALLRALEHTLLEFNARLSLTILIILERPNTLRYHIGSLLGFWTVTFRRV